MLNGTRIGIDKKVSSPAEKVARISQPGGAAGIRFQATNNESRESPFELRLLHKIPLSKGFAIFLPV